MSRVVLPTLLLLATGCSDPVIVDGSVTDVWGTPIQGATVQLEGIVEPVTSDNDGLFKFELKGEAREAYRVQAGKEGYIPGMVKVAGGEDDVEDAAVELYPEPKQPGFYAVGKKAFEHLSAKEIRTVGSDVSAVTGLPDEGEVHVFAHGPVEFIFSSTLKASELARLNLQLHKLEFVEATEVPGVLGDAEVRVNLWKAGEVVEFDLQGMPRDNTYLITTRDKLPKGVYAFSTQGVLASADPAALDKLPKEMRVAYPFSANQ